MLGAQLKAAATWLIAITGGLFLAVSAAYLTMGSPLTPQTSTQSTTTIAVSHDTSTEVTVVPTAPRHHQTTSTVPAQPGSPVTTVPGRDDDHHGSSSDGDHGNHSWGDDEREGDDEF